MSARPAIVVLGPSGLATAERLRRALPGAELHGQRKRLATAAVDRSFDHLESHLQALYRADRPILVIAAAGIPIRLLAPVLADKTREPPVLAIAENGSAVVPLLGGHRGANQLARRIGDDLGCTAAITTAGDLRLGLALDQPPPGWRLADPAGVKPVTAALLASQAVALDVEVGAADWLTAAPIAFARSGDHRILVTDRAVVGKDNELVYHPEVLALGVGCERDVDAAELIGLVNATLRAHGLARAAIGVIGSIDLKAAEPAIHALADHLDVPARFFSAEALEAEAPRLATPSPLVFKETGCHGVAEGAALAAVGGSGELVVAKTKSTRATCAIARAATVIDPAALGRAQGRLAIVGIGPGAAEWRSPEAARLLEQAEDWVGYQGYLDLLDDPALARARRHPFALGEEETRARAALDLAAEGRHVALISSGDAGIYAMASLVFELLQGAVDPAWQRIDVTVSPGISALQAAAARAGAPLGHDFCAISLSDLLTPWTVIERRLEAAARGDFVTALYNPASNRRRQGLARALAILAAERPPTTPVILAKNLGRDGETMAVTELQAFDQDLVDMLSLVIVGSSRTRLARRLHGSPFVFTPRGYLEDDRARSA